MKILLLTNKPAWPPFDGGAFATLCMIKGLSDHGAQITVLYMNTPKHHTEIDEFPETIHDLADFHYVNINSEINKAALLKNLVLSQNPYNLQRFESDKYRSEITKLLVNNYDIVQCEGIALYSYYDTIRNNSKARIVFRSHNVENKIWNELSIFEKNPFKKMYYRVLSRRIKNIENNIVNKYDALVAICAEDLDWFRNGGLTIPSISIPAGIDSSLISFSLTGKQNSIGYIGSLDWAPNILGLTWFIENVWPNVSKKGSDISLHIAGRNGSLKLIKKISGYNISYYGEVPDSTEFIDDKTVIICPVFSGSGIRIKIIEAMSRGKVVIATPSAVEGIDFYHGENILVADSAQKFADCLTLTLTNESLRVLIGKKAIETVQKTYNNFVVTDDLLKFYSTLIA